MSEFTKANEQVIRRAAARAWTCPRLAKALGVSRMTVYRWCKRGEIESFRLVPGGNYYIHEETAQRLLKLHGGSNE